MNYSEESAAIAGAHLTAIDDALGRIEARLDRISAQGGQLLALLGELNQTAGAVENRMALAEKALPARKPPARAVTAAGRKVRARGAS